jgi:hypothetical protein
MTKRSSHMPTFTTIATAKTARRGAHARIHRHCGVMMLQKISVQ